MGIRTLPAAIAGLLVVAAGGSGAGGAAESWFLLGRHGECADLASLHRKVPELGAVRDPDRFLALMAQLGLPATSSPIPLLRGQAREVRVPARELALVFVTAEVCAAAQPAARP